MHTLSAISQRDLSMVVKKLSSNSLSSHPVLTHYYKTLVHLRASANGSSPSGNANYLAASSSQELPMPSLLMSF